MSPAGASSGAGGCGHGVDGAASLGGTGQGAALGWAGAAHGGAVTTGSACSGGQSGSMSRSGTCG
ncbi:hypothetical protein NLX85_29090 [Micromonospora sp. A3M-1-15]|uniref:hypothetical protein n=1 Tax=Micromonospora TaxID=1873 RepID=UPI0020B872C5|nr:hypothetical protein [Micromonospora sp. A3M-1-15]MCP3787429.1 hypothetical protein [Micromonospora sp. A3M-1-15]